VPTAAIPSYDILNLTVNSRAPKGSGLSLSLYDIAYPILWSRKPKPTGGVAKRKGKPTEIRRQTSDCGIKRRTELQRTIRQLSLPKKAAIPFYSS
jgi:hypothetical protein